jgi:hypothetical protein
MKDTILAHALFYQYKINANNKFQILTGNAPQVSHMVKWSTKVSHFQLHLSKLYPFHVRINTFIRSSGELFLRGSQGHPLPHCRPAGIEPWGPFSFSPRHPCSTFTLQRAMMLSIQKLSESTRCWCFDGYYNCPLLPYTQTVIVGGYYIIIHSTFTP